MTDVNKFLKVYDKEIKIILASLICGATCTIGYRMGKKFEDDRWVKALSHLCLIGEKMERVIDHGKTRLILTGFAEHISTK